MSFAIGAVSDTPAIRTFCIFAAIAITICYVYQLVLFAAVIALSGKREQKSYQSLFCCYKVDPQARCFVAEKFAKLHDQVVKFWARSVTQWRMRITLGITMCIYFYFSYVGLCKLQSNISIDKMALPDSYLHDFQHSFETALRNVN